jgi:hypothetical protein
VRWKTWAITFPLSASVQDSVALFHVNHANLGTVGTFDAALLGAARTLLRKQTALGGGYLSLMPRFLIVPAEREDAAERPIAASGRLIVSAADDTVTKWISNLTLVIEPRLADARRRAPTRSTRASWLLEANQDRPAIMTDVEFVKDVQRWKVRHVFGAKFLDWRGIVKQPLT